MSAPATKKPSSGFTRQSLEHRIAGRGLSSGVNRDGIDLDFIALGESSDVSHAVQAAGVFAVAEQDHDALCRVGCLRQGKRSETSGEPSVIQIGGVPSC